MASIFYELDCGQEEPVVIEVIEGGELIFHGWDEEAEAAALELGFDPSQCQVIKNAFEEFTPQQMLAAATREGDTIVAEIAIAAGAEPDEYFVKEALFKAAEGGHSDVLELLLPHVGPEYTHFLSTAVTSGDIPTVATLLKFGYEDRWALAYAAETNQPDMLRFLLNTGSPIILSDEGVALLKAARKGYLEIVEKLIANASSLRHIGYALEAAAAEGHTAVVQALLDTGEVSQGRCSSALRFAGDKGHRAVVELLLEYEDLPAGALNAALGGAVSGRKTEIVALLLAAGANASEIDDDTLLFVGLHEDAQLMELLLESGAYSYTAEKHWDMLTEMAKDGTLDPQVANVVFRHLEEHG